MSQPKVQHHNSADTLAAAQAGEDLSAINSSTIEGVGDMLSVTVDATPVGTTLTPIGRPSAEFIRGIGELRESPSTALLHQLADDPDQPEEASLIRVDDRTLVGRSVQLSVFERREQLVWYGIRDNMYYSVLGDRICVRQDTLESEHSCRTCHGLGYDDSTECPMCDRGQTQGGVECSHCRSTRFGSENKQATGYKPCPDCRATGWRNGIVFPEIAQALPITGVVVSIGPECKWLKIGDRVKHSKFAGHTVVTPEHESFTTMRESEVLGLLMEVRK